MLLLLLLFFNLRKNMFVLSTIFSRSVKGYVYYSKYHIPVGAVNT